MSRGPTVGGGERPGTQFAVPAAVVAGAIVSRSIGWTQPVNAAAASTSKSRIDFFMTCSNN